MTGALRRDARRFTLVLAGVYATTTVLFAISQKVCCAHGRGHGQNERLFDSLVLGHFHDIDAQVRTGLPRYDVAIFFNVPHFLISAYLLVALDAMVRAAPAAPAAAARSLLSAVVRARSAFCAAR